MIIPKNGNMQYIMYTLHTLTQISNGLGKDTVNCVNIGIVNVIESNSIINTKLKDNSFINYLLNVSKPIS